MQLGVHSAKRSTGNRQRKLRDGCVRLVSSGWPIWWRGPGSPRCWSRREACASLGTPDARRQLACRRAAGLHGSVEEPTLHLRRPTLRSPSSRRGIGSGIECAVRAARCASRGSDSVEIERRNLTRRALTSRMCGFSSNCLGASSTYSARGILAARDCGSQLAQASSDERHGTRNLFLA